jgi:hypothetical protein
MRKDGKLVFHVRYLGRCSILLEVQVREGKECNPFACIPG